MARHNAITDVDGITVGHYTDKEAATGCTVVLCESGAVGGVDVRGSSPGTRETDVLRPTTRGTELHGVLLSGGSLFGLDAASGVVRYLEERGVGMVLGGTRLPIVAAAVLFDLGMITDTMFAMATGTRDGPVDLDRVLAAGVVSVARSIRGAVLEATGLGGVPSVRELRANAGL